MPLSQQPLLVPTSEISNFGPPYFFLSEKFQHNTKVSFLEPTERELFLLEEKARRLEKKCTVSNRKRILDKEDSVACLYPKPE